MLDIWKTKPVKEHKTKANYDVRITIQNTKDRVTRLRFGLTNKAAKVFSPYKYLAVSSLEKCKDRIYLDGVSEKDGRMAWKINLANKGKSAKEFPSLEIKITPEPNEEKAYRSKWINIPLVLQYDKDNNLYYVERENKE